MESENLQGSLETYKLQLSQVETALSAAGSEGNQELVQLQADLKELITITEENLLSVKKRELLESLEASSSDASPTATAASGSITANNGNDMDAEFAAFQAAIAEEDTSNSSQPSVSNRDQTPTEDSVNYELENETDHSLDDIIGTKCRAPFSHDWGGLSYHNALILSVEDLDEDCEPKVRVVFCNPTHQSMKPCAFFLEDRCRFSEQDCKCSHGYVVPVEELREFEEPDYSLLRLESPCLGRYQDGLWYPGTVVDVEAENHKYQVMFKDYQQVETLDLEDVFPIVSSHHPSSDSDSDSGDEGAREAVSRSESEDEEDCLPVYLWKPPKTTQAMGEWEVHTRGIGSKLMSRMGYIVGQGLGRDGQGRAEPVPIQLLPQGKSLDKIMELKQIAGDLDLYDVMKKKEKQAKKAAAAAEKRYHAHREKTDVFDFINKKLHSKRHEKGDIKQLMKKQVGRKATDVKHISEHDLKHKNDRSINVQLYKTAEEIKGVKKEIVRLKQGLERNEKRDPGMAKQIRQKLVSMETYLQQLETSERSIERHKQSRKDQKKLTVF